MSVNEESAGHEMTPPAPATISRVPFAAPFTLHVLRDNERCVLPGVCGNKARKLASLVEAVALPRSLVSHGGAQSNAMLALARLCEARGSILTYHTKPIPSWLRTNPTGNLAAALATGSLQLVEHTSSQEYDETVDALTSDATLALLPSGSAPAFVPQGAAWPGAEYGIARLADEIAAWRQRTLPRTATLDLVLPAGTGTTALFLARHVPQGMRVHAVPCVGSSEYLVDQLDRLDRASGTLGLLPHTLAPPPALAVPFGKPSTTLLSTWREAARHGVLLDLVYGPVAWGAMCTHHWPAGSNLLYINCGGQEGLRSQLARYSRGGLLETGIEAETLLEDVCRAAGYESQQM